MATKISPEQAHAIIEDYLSGTTLKELAESTGFGKRALRTFLTTMGVELRGRGSPPAIRLARSLREDFA